MRLLWKTTLLLLKILGAIIGILLLVFTVKYITCPVYDFQPGKRFSGDQFYNPYEGINADHWRRGNFQIQSHAWGGVTSGRGNSNEAIHKLYSSLGYDIIATSDYQKINRYGEGKPGYVPVYEHGYGIQKSHQVLIGSERVLWKDYPFFQTIHNKQHIIASLRDDNALIFLAHPLLRGGYTIEDMKFLSGYDGIEVLNNYRFSVEHWDMALSQGNYVTILGNDDAHDITNPDEIGHHCTFVNTPTLDEADIIASFKAGRAYGARIWRPLGESIPDKIERTRTLPQLQYHKIHNDTLVIECDSVVRFIRFIGQGGKVLKTTENTNTAHYRINKEDTYVRGEIHFWNESALYLNPVCRHDGLEPGRIPAPTVNPYKTWMLRILGFSTLFFVGINVFVLRRRHSKRRA
jgi:hypothetical protein